eukprot:evm.model.scf_924.5 EVM.evm.TU.scf_924.5   scf_924:34125-36018(-)
MDYYESEVQRVIRFTKDEQCRRARQRWATYALVFSLWLAPWCLWAVFVSPDGLPLTSILIVSLVIPYGFAAVEWKCYNRNEKEIMNVYAAHGPGEWSPTRPLHVSSAVRTQDRNPQAHAATFGSKDRSSQSAINAGLSPAPVLAGEAGAMLKDELIKKVEEEKENQIKSWFLDRPGTHALSRRRGL